MPASRAIYIYKEICDLRFHTSTHKKNGSMSTSVTHHKHVGVNFVHLGQEEAEQNSLSRSDLHFPILKEESHSVT